MAAPLLTQVEKMREIRAYLRSRVQLDAETCIPSAWGSDGALAEPSVQEKYHTGAAFTRSVDRYLSLFPPHYVRMPRALLQLRPHEQRVLRYCVIEGHSHRAFAGLQGISVKTVRRWEDSALERLAGLLWEPAEPEWLPRWLE